MASCLVNCARSTLERPHCVGITLAKDPPAYLRRELASSAQLLSHPADPHRATASTRVDKAAKGAPAGIERMLLGRRSQIVGDA